MYDFPWPKTGDKLFTQADGGDAFHLPLWQDIGFSSRFKEAADLLIDAEIDGLFRTRRDELFYPIAYLYRHALELQLKEIVRLGVVMNILTREEIEKAIESHKLSKLWTKAKKTIVERWPDGDKAPLKAVEAVVNEFHQADPNGQTLRYQTDKSGRPNRNKDWPVHVSVSTLRKTMDNTFAFLSACYDGLFESYDAMRSNRSHDGY